MDERPFGACGGAAGEIAREDVLAVSDRARVVRLYLRGGGTVVCTEPLGQQRGERLAHQLAILERLDGVEGVVQRSDAVARADAIVLEDADGPALADELPKGPLETAALLDVLVDLAGVVARVHDHGVVHNNLNPANVVLAGGQRRPVLTDFNLATTFAEDQLSLFDRGEITGPLTYMAPEQTGRTGWPVDQRADLYSLGVTAYELATGGPPFSEADPLQLIRDHLSRTPQPPADVEPGVPAGLSNIIMRLLEKKPDRRYQSARGLVHDLLRLRDELAAGGDGAFALGERDFPLRLSPPAHLVGRRTEIAALKVAFQDSLVGAGRVVLVTGAPGVGKTVLMDRLRPMVLARGGWFVSGKFDRYRQDFDSSGTLQALRELCTHLLAEPEAELASARARLLEALGRNAGLAVTLVPALGILLDVAPEVPSGDPREVEARILRAGIDILHAVVSPARPVVMVVDDLQWSRPITIAFIEAVLTDKGLAGLLLLGAYRDTEVDGAQPSPAMLARWEDLGVAPQRLQLRNLPPAEVGSLLQEMLRLPAEQAAGLAEVIGERTAGNPFDTVQLVNALRGDGALSLGAEGWTWDPVTIRHYVGHGDVVDLLSVRIDVLPPQARGLLAVMASLGGELDLDTLEVASGLSGERLQAELAPALEDGLVVLGRCGERVPPASVRFGHDRVQEAALSHLEPGPRGELHLVLARRLAASSWLEALAAEQYSQVDGNVLGAHERRRAVELLRQGAKSVRLVDHATTERYLTKALGLLRPVQTQADAPLLTALEMELHSVLCDLGRLGESDDVFASFASRDLDPLDLVDATCVQMASLTGRTRFADAVALGLDLLRGLGMELPEDLPAPIAEQFDAVSRWVAETPRGVDTRPEIADPILLAQIKLLYKLHAPAFLVDLLTNAWLVLESQRIWVEHGPCAPLIASAGTAPAFFVSRRDDYRTAYDLSRHAIAVGEAHGYEPATSSVRFMFASCVEHWFEPLEDCVSQQRLAYDGLLRGGDLPYAARTYTGLCAALLDSAATLEACAEAVEAGFGFAKLIGSDYQNSVLVAYRQLLAALRGETDRMGDFQDGSFDEATHLADPAVSPIARAVYHVNRGLSAAISGDPESLAVHSGAAMELLAYVPGFYHTAIAHLLRALSLAGSFRAQRLAPAGERDGLLAELDEHREWLARRAADSPVNFGHLVALVDAERAWAIDDFRAAALAFDVAQEEAAPRHRPWHQGLIAERAGLFHLEYGSKHVGRSLLAEARTRYAAWGAVAKVQQLDRVYALGGSGQRSGDSSERSANPGEAAQRRHGRSADTLTVSTDLVDMRAVLEASQALSSETSLDRLRARVVDVLAAMTGATGVHVVLWDDDARDWRLLPGTGEVQESLSIGDAGARGRVPVSVLRFVARTKDLLLLGDATRDGRFARDPYFTGLDDCSLLVIPVLSGGTMRAMLLLENRLAAGAFSPQELDAVTLITGQLAVSFDNALLYASLEQKVADRTQDLSVANEQLEVLSRSDTLTGLANRRRMNEVLDDEWVRGLRSGQPLGAAIIDIDHFKAYNDQFGHLAGDTCLQHVAKALREGSRAGIDLVCRYGGEEFVLILPGADLSASCALAERARLAVIALGQPHADTIGGPVTVSIGVASVIPTDQARAGELIESADRWLYEAKKSGRNQVAGCHLD
jgi:diguanylate cyclase (GGDEF)-like protein